MTDKELKHLSRAELIEIIYQLQKNEQSLQKKLAVSEKRLSEKEARISEEISNAGSIAQAVVGLSGIFETAQAAADSYLEELHAANEETETKCKNLVEAAQKQADEILARAEADTAALKSETERQVSAKWAELQSKTDELLRAHAALSALLKE